MSSNAIEAQGLVIKRGDGAATEVFTAIPEIKTFSGPGGSSTVIDTSDLNSTSKEKKVGLKDEGQLQMTINYIPDNTVHAGLRTDRANRTLRNFQMVFTDTADTQWDFAAYVTGFSVAGAVDGVVEATITLEISGSITES